MSTVYPSSCRYFQVPQFVVNDALLPKLNEGAVKLYWLLNHEAQHRTKVTFELSAKTISKLAGLHPNLIKKARNILERNGLIQTKRGPRGVYTYTLCDATKQPLPDPRLKYAIPAASQPSTESAPTSPRPRERDRRRLTPEQYRKYFEEKLGNALVGNGPWLSARCPFHPDSKPSFSIHIESGNWHCWSHSCKRHGTIVGFEAESSKCDAATAYRNIRRFFGMNVRPPKRAYRLGEEENFYDYYNETGELLYRLNRYPGKVFQYCRPSAAGGWIRNLRGVRPVLYNLPQLLAAGTVIVTEGERDADRVASLGLLDSSGLPVATTCNPFGAGKWTEKEEEYSRCLLGRRVVILSDMDEALTGQDHSLAVRDAVTPYAAEVRLVWFDKDELGADGKDVSDFLEHHSGQELIEKMGADWFLKPGSEATEQCADVRFRITDSVSQNH
jgi:hypothetical protein